MAITPFDGPGPAYYRSFASYELPFRPVQPVEYAETVGLVTYYAAYRDAGGRVARFDKLGLVRLAKESLEVALPSAEPPGADIYFAAICDAASDVPTVGGRIDYADTEKLGEFFAGHVATSGTTCRVLPYRKVLVFSDAYEYWPDGKPRQRTMTAPGRPTQVSHFDPDGNLILDRAFAVNGAGRFAGITNPAV